MFMRIKTHIPIYKRHRNTSWRIPIFAGRFSIWENRLKRRPNLLFLARRMISFSNTEDGLLIVGVDDETRKVYGEKGKKV